MWLVGVWGFYQHTQIQSSALAIPKGSLQDEFARKLRETKTWELLALEPVSKKLTTKLLFFN